MKLKIFISLIFLFYLGCSSGPFINLATINRDSSLIVFDKNLNIKKSVSLKKPSVISLEYAPSNVKNFTPLTYISLYHNSVDEGYLIKKSQNKYIIKYAPVPSPGGYGVRVRASTYNYKGFESSIVAVDKLPFIYFSIKPIDYSGSTLKTAHIKLAILENLDNKNNLIKFLKMLQQNFSFSSVKSIVSDVNNRYSQSVDIASVLEGEFKNRYIKEKQHRRTDYQSVNARQCNLHRLPFTQNNLHIPGIHPIKHTNIQE